MTQNPDIALTPPELFRRGIEITQEIRGRIVEARAYYLGRSSREPAQPLSEVFQTRRIGGVSAAKVRSLQDFINSIPRLASLGGRTANESFSLAA